MRSWLKCGGTATSSPADTTTILTPWLPLFARSAGSRWVDTWTAAGDPFIVDMIPDEIRQLLEHVTVAVFQEFLSVVRQAVVFTPVAFFHVPAGLLDFRDSSQVRHQRRKHGFASILFGTRIDAVTVSQREG